MIRRWFCESFPLYRPDACWIILLKVCYYALYTMTRPSQSLWLCNSFLGAEPWQYSGCLEEALIKYLIRAETDDAGDFCSSCLGLFTKIWKFHLVWNCKLLFSVLLFFMFVFVLQWPGKCINLIKLNLMALTLHSVSIKLPAGSVTMNMFGWITVLVSFWLGHYWNIGVLRCPNVGPRICKLTLFQFQIT